MKSIIGKKYVPNDNSFSVNVTSSARYPHINKQRLLGGVNEEPAKECIIVSEPFMCKTSRANTNTIFNSCKMVMVDYQDETHMVLFDVQYIKD